MTVGFIGLGQMGAPMAGHLVASGDLVVCDTQEAATEAFSAKGIPVAASPAEVARKAQVISVMVLDDDQVREVVLGEDGIVAGAREGTVVSVHSTIRAGTAEELAAEVVARGIAIVDAPVSGGFVGAHKGTLAVMAGGPDEAVKRCREPFGRWASLFVHVGPTGAGTRAKLARNLLHFIAFTGAGEAQRLAEAAGIDLSQLMELVLHSDRVTGGPGAIMFRGSTEPLKPDDRWYETLIHVRALGEKDLSLALDLAAELGVELPLGTVALQRFAAEIGLPPGAATP